MSKASKASAQQLLAKARRSGTYQIAARFLRLEETCQCPRNFPLLVLVAQISTLVLAVVIWPSLFGTTLPKPNEVEEWLSKRWQNVLRARGIAGPVVATQASQASGNLEADVSSANLRGAVETKEPSTPLPAPAGWLSAGEGYCEDGKTHQEFNSLHAVGKTLQECADVAMSDPESVALDFSTADGGCDIRFPAGSLFQSVPGFDWWGWGAGESAPRGSGTRKHDSATHCFVPQQRAPPARPVREVSATLHPNYKALIQEYPFQPVRNERGDFVNIILVRSPFRTKRQEKLFQQFKNEILFMGISSWEDFPLPAPNPFSESFPKDKFVGLFPGFLYMHREPEKLFPSHVKLLLLSQSDFALPGPAQAVPKKYDFTFSGSDQDVDQDCVGWSSFAKNWTFAKEALEVMCGERMTGVLVATKNKPVLLKRLHGCIPMTGVEVVPPQEDHRPAFFGISASFFCLFLYYSFFARFAVLIYTHYGLDGREIGVIGLLSILASIPASSFWGLVADRSGRRKLVLACCLGMATTFQTLLCLAPYIQDHTYRFMYCCTMMVCYTAARGNDYGQLRGITMRTLERFNRQGAYGNLRLWGAVSWGIAHPVLGWLLDVEHGQLQMLFIGNALSALLAVACFSLLLQGRWTDESSASQHSDGGRCQGDSDAGGAEGGAQPRQQASLRALLQILYSRPEMITWLLCAATQAMGMQHVFQFLFLYMQERFHSTDILMGFSVTVTVLFEIPIFAVSEKIVPKLGPTVLIAIAMASFVVRVLGYTIVPGAAWLLLLEPLHGVTYSCFTLATVHYLNEHVPMHMISTAQGFMSSITACGSAFGAVLGGWLMDLPNGGLILFRSDTVIMSLVLVLFLASQKKSLKSAATKKETQQLKEYRVELAPEPRDPQSTDAKGLITQTTFLSQDEFFAYVKQSRFLFLPQVHDASPRVITQALALDVPLLMNRNLIGGWKYLTETTGEFFSDATDIKQSAQRLLTKAAGGEYSPR
ncbi:MFSD6, partial [Symbiodinium sp. CCMP2456]